MLGLEAVGGRGRQQHFRFRWLALIVLFPVRGHAAVAEISQTCFALSCPTNTRLSPLTI